MYFFIFSPNNSGTTAASQYLAAGVDAYLPPYGNFEGQFAPDVIAIMRNKPWSSERKFDFHYIKTAWDKLLADSGKKIFVEASPPNLIRVADILDAFGGEARAVFMMASPYMQIASELKNYSTAPLRAEDIQRVAESWISKASRQADNRKRWPDIPYLTYEAFCAKPSRLLEAFGINGGLSDAAIAGKKNSGVRELRDMSLKTAAFLTEFEAVNISRYLAPEASLVESFGYKVESVSEIEARYDASPAQLHAGMLDRVRWEMRPADTRLRRWVRRRPRLKQAILAITRPQ